MSTNKHSMTGTPAQRTDRDGNRIFGTPPLDLSVPLNRPLAPGERIVGVNPLTGGPVTSGPGPIAEYAKKLAEKANQRNR